MKHLIKNKNKIHLPAHIEILKTGVIINFMWPNARGFWLTNIATICLK